MRRHSLAAASLGLFLLAGAGSCRSQDSRLDDLEAGTVTQRVRIFLIAPRDNGAQGRSVGCGDSAVPTAVTLDHPRPALYGALEALIDGRERHDKSTRLNAKNDCTTLPLH